MSQPDTPDDVICRPVDQHDPAYQKHSTQFGVYANKYFEKRGYELKLEYICEITLGSDYDEKIARQNPQTLNEFNYAFDLSLIKKKESNRYSLHSHGDGKTVFVGDASKYKNIGAFINDYRDDINNYEGPQRRKEPNCKILDFIINGKPRIFITNTKPIHKGEQLLLDYGNDFWNRFHYNNIQAEAAKQMEAKADKRVKEEKIKYANKEKKHKKKRKRDKKTINQLQNQINEHMESLQEVKKENKRLRIQFHKLDAERLCNTPEERSLLETCVRNHEEM